MRRLRWLNDGESARTVRSGLVAAAAASALLISVPGFAACTYGRVARLPVTMEGMRASVPVTVNGTPTRFWLDSGAFFNFMSKAKATELALPLKPMPEGIIVTGVGGSANVQVATIRAFGIADANLKNIEFLVGGSDSGNGLIGLNLLDIYDTEYDLANGMVDFIRAKNCGGANLAHWAGDKVVTVIDKLPGVDVIDTHIYGGGQINGKDVRLMFDTGAPTTVLTRAAAERIGIDLSAPGVIASTNIGGIGSKSRQSWIVKLASFEIGGEAIRNTPIRVIDESNKRLNADVILGADFFLAHHILVASSQRRIYLTYNGGPVFSLSTDGETGKTVTRAESAGGAAAAAAPAEADEFARRGAARLARGDSAAAIADFNEAIRLDPEQPAYFRDRARAREASGDLAAAARDIDAAIALAPDDAELRIVRAAIRYDQHDRAGALADAEAAGASAPAGALDNMDLVVLFERLEQPRRAVALLDPMIALHPADPKLGSLLNSRCWARGLANVELDKALADCDAAIRKDGPRQHNLDSRALVHLRQRDYAAAIADYDAALKIDPNAATSLYLRGWTHRAAGDAACGAADMAAARRINPDVASRFKPYGLGE